MTPHAGLFHRRLKIVKALPARGSAVLLVTRKQTLEGSAGLLPSKIIALGYSLTLVSFVPHLVLFVPAFVLLSRFFL